MSMYYLDFEELDLGDEFLFNKKKKEGGGEELKRGKRRMRS